MDPVRSSGRRAPLEALGRKNQMIFPALPYPSKIKNNTMSSGTYDNENRDGLLTGRINGIFMLVGITSPNRAGCEVYCTSAPYF